MLAARSLRFVARPALAKAVPRPAAFAAVRFSSTHAEESYEEFNARYRQFFGEVTDLFELQRGLNNAFAYDLVPSTEVVEAALRASRKVNDYATAVRILEGVKEKVENKGQYESYINELKPVIEELGIQTKEQLYNL
ncbi:COX5A-domain-containing protein [Cutaneotrichosporon oleaginosum]|uniref:Cytochrome c oxidase subunit 6, mitochondrial n=1 Tax=Cutaneotrichosporon oleaginosum TaxID=879819 RepID=A0A0J0XEE4_9TREE|nr:COX5A-domain-containing protein [Cutaneotrichosporon oleaginosum]KLT39422.1 COX5A-domain-containing protein [Cutaneotrichosporon oleaginosum]TXT15375.1 hypothetical protein COLE_01568 [Cutaneotrichosporon oleaginosum]